MLVKIYQIYYEDQQRAKCERHQDWELVKNTEIDFHFENKIISKLVPLCDSEYVGVVSWRLREKLKRINNLFRVDPVPFVPNIFNHKLNKLQPDAMSFFSKFPHDPIAYAEKWHPNFVKLFSEVLEKIGEKYTPQIYQHTFYCNYFVAKNEVYKKYISELLNPAISAMDTMPELMADSKYARGIPPNLGIPFYPYHAFISERLFSYFALKNNLNVTYYS